MLAFAFQEAVVDVLVGKTCAAAERLGVAEIALAGGVAANGPLREALRQRAPVPLRVPALRHCTDNAAMIAGAGYFRLTAGDVSGSGPGRGAQPPPGRASPPASRTADADGARSDAAAALMRWPAGNASRSA